jgi:hypothetical protein
MAKRYDFELLQRGSTSNCIRNSGRRLKPAPRVRLAHYIAIVIVVAASLAASVNAPIYLGVLEPPLAGKFHVRVAFRFEDGGWHPMPHEVADQDTLAKIAASFPERMSWTIARSGKKLGEVRSARPRAYSAYSEIGREDLAAGADPPKVRDGAANFATWMGTPQFRPLVAISAPNYRDPDGWAPFDVSAVIRTPAIAAFRRQTALDVNCDGHSTRNYPDSAIETFGKPLRSRHGDVLIAMRPDPRLNRCEGPAGEEWQSVWFLVKGGNFRWIGNALTLLDIGDYDGDGASKVLFQYDGYDSDGYVLLDPRDGSESKFSWLYQ